MTGYTYFPGTCDCCGKSMVGEFVFVTTCWDCIHKKAVDNLREDLRRILKSRKLTLISEPPSA